MDSSISVARLATDGDIPAIADIHLAGWRWAYEGMRLATALDALSVEERRNIWRSTLADEPAGARLWVGEREGRVVGFLANGPPRVPGKVRSHLAEIYALYLAREHAGTGLGRLLVTSAMADARGRGQSEVYVSVLAANERARRFYERCGWQAVLRRTDVHEGEELPTVLYRRFIEEIIPRAERGEAAPGR